MKEQSQLNVKDNWEIGGAYESFIGRWSRLVAAEFLDSQAAILDEGKRFPLCNPERLRDLFVAQGLDHVDVRSIDVQTHFVDFQNYWTPFLSGQGPAPSYVASLTKKQQSDLRERVRTELPISTDGTINLIARAWAVRGYSYR